MGQQAGGLTCQFSASQNVAPVCAITWTCTSCSILSTTATVTITSQQTFALAYQLGWEFTSSTGFVFSLSLSSVFCLLFVCFFLVMHSLSLSLSTSSPDRAVPLWIYAHEITCSDELIRMPRAQHLERAKCLPIAIVWQLCPTVVDGVSWSHAECRRAHCHTHDISRPVG